MEWAEAMSYAARPVIGGRMAPLDGGAPVTRAVLLMLASFPALYVLLAVALTIVWLPQAAKGEFMAALLQARFVA